MAPHGRKYIWNVMPFGPRNCPPVFIGFTSDLREEWTELKNARLPINHLADTKLIMDDILLYSNLLEHIKILLECVLTVCRKYNLTLKLKKTQFFNPTRLEFVGVDLTKRGLIPAHSKFNLLRDWPPPPSTKRMHSFVGFASFYKKWIPFFELVIQPF